MENGDNLIMGRWWYVQFVTGWTNRGTFQVIPLFIHKGRNHSTFLTAFERLMWRIGRGSLVYNSNGLMIIVLFCNPSTSIHRFNLLLLVVNIFTTSWHLRCYVFSLLRSDAEVAPWSFFGFPLLERLFTLFITCNFFCKKNILVI